MRNTSSSEDLFSSVNLSTLVDSSIVSIINQHIILFREYLWGSKATIDIRGMSKTEAAFVLGNALFIMGVRRRICQ